MKSEIKIKIKDWFATAIELYKDKKFCESESAIYTELFLILEEILGLNKIDIQLCWDKDIQQSKLNKLNLILDERQNYKPLSKIFGSKYFYGLKFFVNSYVLDPRPETELIVELSLKTITKLNIHNVIEINILDLGAGSGCIDIAILKSSENTGLVRCLLLDICSRALNTAIKNTKYHKVGKYVWFLKSNWFEKLDNNQKFNIIISNPPYVSIDEEVGRETKFDPKKALYAKEDGFANYRQLFTLDKNNNTISSYLTEDGIVFMEIPSRFEEKILEISKDFKYKRFFNTGAENIKIFACSNNIILQNLED